MLNWFLKLALSVILMTQKMMINILDQTLENTAVIIVWHVMAIMVIDQRGARVTLWYSAKMNIIDSATMRMTCQNVCAQIHDPCMSDTLQNPLLPLVYMCA